MKSGNVKMKIECKCTSKFTSHVKIYVVQGRILKAWSSENLERRWLQILSNKWSKLLPPVMFTADSEQKLTTSESNTVGRPSPSDSPVTSWCVKIVVSVLVSWPHWTTFQLQHMPHHNSCCAKTVAIHWLIHALLTPVCSPTNPCLARTVWLHTRRVVWEGRNGLNHSQCTTKTK